MTSETVKRILQVEDHRDTAEMVTLSLSEIGYQVETVGTCKEGVEAIREERFDLYLFDNLLPDGTGIELCGEVRQRDENTPIIFHSGADDQDDKEAALAAGVDAYLTKPADPDEIIIAIRKMLNQQVPGA